MSPKKMVVEFSDRYSSLGMTRPNPKTVCKGKCEGTGWVPVNRKELENTFGQWATLWHVAHREAQPHNCDGWHFVKCPNCAGTGRRN